MSSKWTDEQLQAINERGRNILVSAGAGSGKTAVMVERVVRLIMEDRVPVSAMLIVTFTKAAASEMKERLRKALKDRLAETGQQGSGDRPSPEEQAWIREQLDQLHNAQISTFHSFAQRVLKEFFYFTDIEPGFRVLDEPESEVLKEQAVEELFDAEYEEDREDFIAFLDAYSGEKNDNDARDMIRELYRKLEAVPDRFNVLDKKAEELTQDLTKFRGSDTFRRLSGIIIRELNEALESAVKAEDFLKDNGLDRMALMVEEDAGAVREALERAEALDTDKCVNMLRQVKFNTLRTKGKDEKELYTDEIKGSVKAIREDYKARVKGVTGLYYTDLSRMVRSMQLTGGYARTLSRLEKHFDQIYSELKRDINGIDYSDMEHYAYQILCHEEASSFYREQFQYIFVDEYQDTNIMQETIISMIKRDTNLFMVGDIKQSIYHFRLADPEIFKAKYAEYKAEGEKGDSAVSIKIDLNRNFRSKSFVLDEINKMFRPLMDGYDKGAELIPGSPDGACLLDPPETHIVDTAGQEEEEDEELADMQKEELEACEAARIISSLIGKKYTDSKTGETRTVSYKDIVILMRSFRRSAEGYRSVFSKCRIPLYIDDRSGYFDSIEINVFLSLLQVIDNKRQDVPFIALLRSEIFGFSCMELAMIRKLHRKGSFVDAALSAVEDEAAPDALRAKCRKVFDDIRKWQAYAVTIPLPDMIWRLMNETGYYMTAGTLPDGAVRQANLRLLADRAREYSERSLGSLYGFIRYIEQVKSNKVDMPQAALLSENDDVVRIMTVHHSKGLEFPVVILAGMDNSHRGSGMSKLAFDREEGLGLRAVDPENHLYEDGIITRMIREKEHESEVDELKRVFYVAVTRARETFYLLGVSDFDREMERLETSVFSDSTLLKMSRYLPCIKCISREEAKEIDAATEDAETEKIDGSKLTDSQREALERLGFEYPYKEAGSLEAKTSVTGLNDKKEKVTRIEEPEFMSGSHGISAAERGTVYHGILERLDFTKSVNEGRTYIEDEMDRLKEQGVFTGEELGSVSSGKIMKFFESSLGKRAAKAYSEGCLHREQPFETKITMGGEDVLVQGVIDCYFEEPDGIVLYDYKTNRIDKTKPPEEEQERIVSLYRTQLDLYSNAIEDALGKKVKERYLYLFSIDREVEVR